MADQNQPAGVNDELQTLITGSGSDDNNNSSEDTGYQDNPVNQITGSNS